MMNQHFRDTCRILVFLFFLLAISFLLDQFWWRDIRGDEDYRYYRQARTHMCACVVFSQYPANLQYFIQFSASKVKGIGREKEGKGGKASCWHDMYDVRRLVDG